MKQFNEMKKRDFFKLNLLRNAELVGYLGLPKIKGTQMSEKEISTIPFNYINTVERPQNHYLHFYLDDYQFERIWNNPTIYTEMLKQYKGVFAPDFSLYMDLPRSYQIWNLYRSRVLTYYWQSQGVNVIPNATWSDEQSFAWCFDGLPKHSPIAVSSIGCMQNKETILNFCKGFQAMDKALSPTLIYFYGKIPESLKNDKRIINIETFTQMRFDNLEELQQEQLNNIAPLFIDIETKQTTQTKVVI